MPTIQLKAMTRELCHELYKHWTNDASIYMDMHLFQPYVYDEAAVNRYFDMKGQDASRRLFAIMLGDKVIGELQLKQIDHDKKECSLSIHMQNDAVKGRGYGTQAERLAVKTAFDELGMAAVNADTIRKNTRSQHVLEKVGFRFAGEDETFRCTVRTSLASPLGRGGRAQRVPEGEKYPGKHLASPLGRGGRA